MRSGIPSTQRCWTSERPELDGGVVDALTRMAVKLYARWQFDYRGKGEQYRQAYESLKAVLSLCPEYREDDGDG